MNKSRESESRALKSGKSSRIVRSFISLCKRHYMQKSEIIRELKSNYRIFIDFIKTLEEEKFQSGPNGKWTPGQHFDHIRLSIQQLPFAYGLPKFILRFLFGKANRPSRTYDGLVQRYREKLSAGGQATGRYVPKTILIEEKGRIERSLLKNLDQLTRRIEKYAEKDLDTYLLPHPLLGKLTLREMLYFTIYHVEHHRVSVERDLRPS